MIYKLKTLGLALVAVLAMSAAVASAAQAQWTANSYPTTVTATSTAGNEVFTLEDGNVECTGHFEGSLPEASLTLTITPIYTECKGMSLSSAAISMNGCDYVFHSNGEVDIACSGSNRIVIVAGGCEAQIGSQNGLKSVALSNNGAHINVLAGVGSIAYTVTKDGFLCPFTGTGAKSGGVYHQNKAVTFRPVSGGTSVSVD